MASLAEADLLAGIVAHPAELNRWLVLADWLEDQGDPRAELARLRYLLHTEPDHPEADARRARQLALLDAGLAPVVPTWTNALGMPFALVLPGTFWMGGTETDAGSNENVVLHSVTLKVPYMLGVFPVTVGEFEAFVAATNYTAEVEKRTRTTCTWRTPGFTQDALHPVVCVTWNDAQALVTWLNRSEWNGDTVYALPTEAQWEYACRAGSTRAYFWGDDPNRPGEYAWVGAKWGDATHPVGGKKPNPWGLYEMHGHVWEWCSDLFGAYPVAAVEDPSWMSNSSSRVIRGGNWNDSHKFCTAERRAGFHPDDGNFNVGLRLARVIDR